MVLMIVPVLYNQNVIQINNTALFVQLTLVICFEIIINNFNNLNKLDCSHITDLQKCSSGIGCVACASNNDCQKTTLSKCHIDPDDYIGCKICETDAGYLFQIYFED